MKRGKIYILQEDIRTVDDEHYVPAGTEYMYCSFSDAWSETREKEHFLKTIQGTPHQYGQACSVEDFEKMFKEKQ